MVTKRSEFIFMLTQHDQTVGDAIERLDDLGGTGVRVVGFKDIGLSNDELGRLASQIRARGWEVALEVVSLGAEAEHRSIRLALDLGVDWLLGGTRPQLALPLIQNAAIRYCPFPGLIEGHPSKLRGTKSEIVASAIELARLDGVFGLDLLAYRWDGCGAELIRSVVEAIGKPVIVAGDIDSAQRIHDVIGAGAAGFTVGSAAFAGKFAGDGLRHEISEILNIIQVTRLTTEANPTDVAAGGLYHLAETLRRYTWIDLTHVFHPGIPHCHFFDPEERKVLFHYDQGVGSKGAGFLAEEYRHVGQWGTHVDPPAHFIRGLRFQDEIPVQEMILSLVVLDVHQQAKQDADYCVRMADVWAWERRNGKIPPRSFVALRTDWSKRWPDSKLMQNKDAAGASHFPGWSREVLEYLYEERGILASGHDTTDTDAGLVVSEGKAPLEAYVLGLDKWQIELMTNLDQVPECGAVIVATWPKPLKGSGFPARVFAIFDPAAQKGGVP